MNDGEVEFQSRDRGVLSDLQKFATGIARARGTSPEDRLSASKCALFFSKQLEGLGRDETTEQAR